MQWVEYSNNGGIVEITMNRPRRLNAWGSEMARDLTEAFERYKDDKSARVAILRGNGRAFCAGADAKEYTERRASWTAIPRDEMGAFGKGTLFKPVIGAIHGHCLGAGFILLAARCDIRIAAADAQFGLPEVKVGIVNCEVPLANQGLPLAFLMELSMTGDSISAERAMQVGFVNKVVPNEALLDEARAMAARIAVNSPMAVQLSKENLLKAVEVSQEAKDNETRIYGVSSNSHDAVEGFEAHVQGRAPVWESV